MGRFNEAARRPAAVFRTMAISVDIRRIRATFLVSVSLLTTTLLANQAHASPGDLDPSFGMHGLVLTNIVDHGYEVYGYADSMAIQGDGKIVVVGPGEGGCAVARYNTDGKLDSSFHGDGILTTFAIENCDAVAIQGDGKLVIAGSVTDSEDGSVAFAVVRYNTDGTFDTNFDGDGRAVTSFGGPGGHARAVVIQSDGKILVAGDAFRGDPYRYSVAVVRYATDGSLDSNFDGDGKVITYVGDSASARAIAVQADHKIVTAGWSQSGDNSADFTVVRYNPDGTLDPTFDTDGWVTTDFDSSDSGTATSVAMQDDGKIVVAGNSQLGSVVARYNADGSLDTSFDEDGTVTTSLEGGSSANAITIQDDGKIVVAGEADGGALVVRYASDGALDADFDSDGATIIVEESIHFAGRSVAIDGDENIVVAGGSENESSGEFVVARLTAGGVIDSNFGVDGTAIAAVGGLSDMANALSIQTDGKILAAGITYSSENNWFSVARYTTNGQLDDSFGSGGRVLLSPRGWSLATSLVVQPDQRIVIAGPAYDFEGESCAVVRITADGAWDMTATTDTPGASEGNCGLALQLDGKIVVAGAAKISGDYYTDFLLLRYTPDGTLDSSFDGDGQVTTAFSSAHDFANALAIQDDGRIVAVGGANSDPYQSTIDIAVARYMSDGSLDASFDGDGRVTTPIGPSDDYATAVAIQADGKIVVAGVGTRDTYDRHFTIVRYNPDGSLDEDFGSNGKVVTPIGSSSEAHTIAIQVDGKIVVAGTAFVGEYEYRGGGPRDFVVVRYDPDGSLDANFGVGGKTVVDFSLGDDAARSVALQDNGSIVVAGWSGGDFAVARYVAAECGDGVVDVREDCDLSVANGSPDACCDANCGFVAPASACAADGDVCTDDICDDAGGCVHVLDPTNDPSCASTTTTTVTTTTIQVSTTTTLPESACGDPSGDGSITATDALISLTAAVGIEQCSLAECDVNGDGKVTASDALVLLKVSVGEPIELNCPT